MPSKVWQVRTELQSILTAPLAALDCKVFDGPQSHAITLPKKYVLIGSDGGDTGQGDSSGEGMTADQQWADLSNTGRKNETGEIICSAWIWGGKADFVPLRADLDDVLAAFESTLITNRRMPTVLTSGWVELARVGIREMHIDDGAAVRASCSITYHSRLN